MRRASIPPQSLQNALYCVEVLTPPESRAGWRSPQGTLATAVRPPLAPRCPRGRAVGRGACAVDRLVGAVRLWRRRPVS